MDARDVIKRFAKIADIEVARARPRLRFVTLDVDDLRARADEALVRGFGLFDPRKGSLEAWLHYYVRHRLADALGARAIRRNEADVEDLESVVNGANPEDLVLLLERRETAQRVFQGLPPRQYAIVSMAIAGATVRETARSLGISAACVHRERRRAFATLQKRWETLRARDD